MEAWPEPVRAPDLEPQSDEENDADPVVAEYDVYLAPTDETRQLYLFQYPNRPRRDTFKRHTFPSEMRLKPESGFIEVDLPVHFTNFDRSKGVKWGEALRQAKDEGMSSFGVSGGFSSIGRGKKGGGKNMKRETADGVEDGDMEVIEDEEEQDDIKHLLVDFDDSVKKGHVLDQQTLGGQIVKKEPGHPVYMLGAFKEGSCQDQLHLTAVNGIVQMRPQFHHIDAQTRLDQAARRRAERGPAEPAGTEQARTIFENIKDNDQTDARPFRHFQTSLQKSKDEPWTKLQYHNEDSAEAYEAYYDSLFLSDRDNAEELTASMTNAEYLEAISAQRVDPSRQQKKKPLTKKQAAQLEEID
ncbi:hypothetical protein NA57DRAFT_52872 [Rhizodiscina lignyota]|uniref:DNA-directed RNA polymerase III subunit Rpc5 n=1 Tax=Rhizodiscina lignyota TaxID=1504668 RepID=A0A9P4M9Z1_9PEZI|nr:hypothetical protein NA57DRAFT_52872 [Rhizodiscina lignyota]